MTDGMTDCMNNSLHHYLSRGQSLVEVTVASAALMFGLVAIVSGLILSVRNSTQANKQAIATQKAQEGVEIFRKYQRELGWEAFQDVLDEDGTPSTYCITTLPTDNSEFQGMTLGSCSFSQTETDFIREASVDVQNDNIVAVTVTVSWRDGTNTRTAHAKNIFKKYQ